MRLTAAHQVDVAQLPASLRWQPGRPDEAGRSGAEQVEHRHRRGIVQVRTDQQPRPAPGVARLVEVNADPVATNVKQVGDPAAIDVGEPDPTLVEQLCRVKPRREVHADPRAEAAIALVRPVADRAVRDPDQVGQAIAGHVGQVHRLGAVGEHQPRPALLVGRRVHRLGGAESALCAGWIPGQRMLLSDQHVSVPVTVDIDKAQVRVVPVDDRQRLERRELAPAARVSTFVETRGRTRKLHEVQPPVTGEI